MGKTLTDWKTSFLKSVLFPVQAKKKKKEKEKETRPSTYTIQQNKLKMN